MSRNPVQIGRLRCGQREPLLWIAGPCVLQSPDLAMRIAAELRRIADRFSLSLVFKASFDKANRTSATAHRGPGLDAGLEVLAKVKREFDVPITTDIHLPNQAPAAGEVCDLLQIPAFLARQTDLLLAAAQTGRAVNVKKGQFMAPREMEHVLGKLAEGGCQDVLLCERGTFFGYGRLVNDMRAIPQMQSLGAPVVFDATHSVQEPGSLGDSTGGNRQMVEPLARAAVAVGADGLFFETHPEPEESPSDGPNMIPLDRMESLMERIVAIWQATQSADRLASAESTEEK